MNTTNHYTQDAIKKRGKSDIFENSTITYQKKRARLHELTKRKGSFKRSLYI